MYRGDGYFNLRSTVREEFDELKRLDIEISDRNKNLIIPQTILGRAHMGHGGFKGNSTPELTIDQVALFLEMDPYQIRKKREKDVYEIKKCFDQMFSGKKTKLTDSKGRPLLGIKLFENLNPVIDKGFFKGAAFAAMMDSDYWRNETVKYYPKTLDGEELIIGCGKEYAVNSSVMKNYKITELDLSQKGHSLDDLKFFKEIGLIDENSTKSKKLENMFIRTRKGNGCCDDACGIVSAFLSGNEDSFSSWGLVDGSDTYTKWILHPIKGGLDEMIGKYIMEKWKEKYHEDLVTPEEIMTVIYLGAKNNFPRINMSSSHRRFFQREMSSLPITLELHKKWLTEGKRPEEDCRFAFARVPSNQFYDAMNYRMHTFGLTIPEQKKEIVREEIGEIKFDKVPRKIKKQIKVEVAKQFKGKEKCLEEYAHRINKWQRKNKNYRPINSPHKSLNNY